MAGVKFDRDGGEGRKTLGLGNCSINIWDESKMELDWSKKKTILQYFYYLAFRIQQFLGFTLSILYWVNFLVMKTFSNIFRCTFCWTDNIWIYPIYFLLLPIGFVYITTFFIAKKTNSLCTPEPRFCQLSWHGATYRPGIVGIVGN